MLDEVRAMPSDLEAEEAVLGSVLIDGDAIYRLMAFLKPEDFYREKNQWLYEACVALAEKFEPIDQVTVAHKLSDKRVLEDIGGASYLSHLISIIPTSVHAEHYGRMVQGLAIRRQLIRAAHQICDIGYDGGPDTAGMLARADSVLRAVGSVATTEGLVSIHNIGDELQASVSAWLEDPNKLRGVPTGFKALDRAIGGWEREKLYILAGRPSMGKTQLALKLAKNAAENGYSTAFFSPDSSKAVLFHRLLTEEAKIDGHALRVGKKVDKDQIWDAYYSVCKLKNLYIDDTGAITIDQVTSRALRWMQEAKNPLLLIFDYVEQAKQTAIQEEQRIARIIRGLREIARELKIAVVAICQLSREVEKSFPPIPRLHHLRWSGSQEQEGNCVMLLYRDAFYWPLYEDRERQIDKRKEHYLRVEIAKQKDGPTGVIGLYYNTSLGVIGDWEGKEMEG